ncbi:MAG: FtsX-like permease family protein [Candidatus Pacebacteria bacterium]|nr:FtsX-like permease family protein [Candidatus Paceibacterota bacterium]
MAVETQLRNGSVPQQKDVSWGIAMAVSWAGLRRRLLRALITMAGVILAISFLSYMLITDSITQALVAVNNDRLNVLLQNTGVDVFGAEGTDQMTLLLIGLSLLTCFVGIVNAMLMSVTERVREIGTLKCLGACDSFIVKSYLIESAVQGLIGALIGMIVGLLVSLVIAIVNYKSFVFTNFPVLPILKALVLSFLTGTLLAVIASIWPAYLAARKQPVDALRIEE